MYKRRTDMAVESRELYGDGLKGVESSEREENGFKVTEVTVKDEESAKILSKPVGKYITLELGSLIRREEDAFVRGAGAIACEIKKLLPLGKDSSVLVAGLGNERITPDALGYECIKHVMVTRHIKERMPEYFAGLRSVSAITPGVLGTTGVETAEILRGVISRVKPDAVIIVDALASRSLGRVCASVQACDTGIVPGSGVGSSRAALNRETLGVEVAAVGVPTVVDAATLVADVLEDSGIDADVTELEGKVVTPKEIDERVSETAKVIGYGINLALHDGISVEDVDMFL